MGVLEQPARREGRIHRHALPGDPVKESGKKKKLSNGKGFFGTGLEVVSPVALNINDTVAFVTGLPKGASGKVNFQALLALREPVPRGSTRGSPLKAVARAQPSVGACKAWRKCPRGSR